MDRERFQLLKSQPWDGETPVCLWRDDRYFWSADEFEEWLEDEAIDRDQVMLVHAEPRYARPIDESDYSVDELPEDGELPAEIVSAIAAFNAALKSYGKPLSWVAGNVRVEWEQPNYQECHSVVTA